jgi:hypothetical protein
MMWDPRVLERTYAFVACEGADDCERLGRD